MSNCSVPVPQLPQASCPCLMSEEEKASQSFNVSASLWTTQPRGVQFQPQFNLASLWYYNLYRYSLMAFCLSHNSTFYTPFCNITRRRLLSIFNDSTSHATSVQPHHSTFQPHFNLVSLCFNFLSVQLQGVSRFSHNSTFIHLFLHHNTASPQIHKCFNLGTSVQPHGIPFQPPFNLVPI